MKLKLLSIAIASTLVMSTQAADVKIDIKDKPESITFVSWGGAYSDAQRNAYSQPFEDITGINVIDEAQGGNAPAALKAQHQAGQVTWDVVDVLEGAAITLCDEGIAMEIDYDTMLAPGDDGSKPTDDFIGGLNGCFVPVIIYSTVFSYNDDLFPGEKPTTVADAFNLEKFPGKRGLEKIPEANLEWALVADGVAIEDVYDVLGTPEGVDRAFAKLDTIKDSVIWWEQGAQPVQLLADEEVAISSAYNGRIFSAAEEEGQPLVIMWDGQMFEYDGVIIPTNAPNKEAALAFLRFASDTQRLADQSKYISYGPTRKSSGDKVDKHATLGIDMRPHMPSHPDNFKTPIKKDAEFWADNRAELAERFNAWLAQ